jgi:hypothetical protein
MNDCNTKHVLFTLTASHSCDDVIPDLVTKLITNYNLPMFVNIVIEMINPIVYELVKATIGINCFQS